MVEQYDSVFEFLDSQRRGRPQTYEEITYRVKKARRNVVKELNGLMVRGMICTIIVRFNNREVPFYTVRQRVIVSIVKDVELNV